MMRILIAEKEGKSVQTYSRLDFNGSATTLASSKEQTGQMSGRRKNGACEGAIEKM
jgi:hypothetical protein